MPHTPAAPRNQASFLTRPFVLLCLFYFLVFVLGYQLLPVVPLHLRALGAGLGASGRFTTAFTLGSAVGALFTGALGDRMGQRRVLLGASLLSTAFFGAYAFLNTPWAFSALALFHGLVWSGLRTASVAQAGALLLPEHRAEGMSIFGLASPAGVAVGPALGLALWPLLGFRGLVLGLGLGFLVLAGLVIGQPKDTPRRSQVMPLLPEPLVVLPALVLFLLGLTYGPIPPFAAQEARYLHLFWPSALLSSVAGGMVGLRLILGMVGMGQKPLRLLKPMLLLTALGMALLALLPGGTLRHALGGALYGGGFALSHTLLFMVILARSHPTRRGAAVGALYFSYDVGQALGALLLGHAMETAGGLWGTAAGYRTGWGLAALAALTAFLLAERARQAKGASPPDSPPATA